MDFTAENPTSASEASRRLLPGARMLNKKPRLPNTNGTHTLTSFFRFVTRAYNTSSAMTISACNPVTRLPPPTRMARRVAIMQQTTSFFLLCAQKVADTAVRVKNQTDSNNT